MTGPKKSKSGTGHGTRSASRKKPGLTLLVKTFLRDPYLFKCIESFRDHYPDVPIVVADDGEPTDEKRSLGVKYLELPFDSGVPHGRNTGVQNVETEYVLVVDDDTYFTGTERLDEMHKLLEISDVVCGSSHVAGKETHYEGVLRIDGSMLHMTPVTGPIKTHKNVRYIECDLALNLTMARTETLREHPWDTEFKVAYEHLDWFLAVQKAGLKVLYAPDSRFAHRPKVEGVDGARYMRFRWRKPWRGRFFHKWGLESVRNLSGHIDHLEEGGSMADTYYLTAPNGQQVEVTSEARRDELVNNRGYTENTPTPKKTTAKKTTRKKTAAKKTTARK